MAAARLKMPAYGKRLLLERRAGRHPLELALVYGERWWEVEQPKICIKPCEYEPGKYDLRMVAGLKVVVHDQDLGVLDYKAATVTSLPIFGKFYDLLHELALCKAYVEIRWPEKSQLGRDELSAFAYACRHPHPTEPRMIWPRWWSDALDTLHHESHVNHLIDVGNANINAVERDRAA